MEGENFVFLKSFEASVSSAKNGVVVDFVKYFFSEAGVGEFRCEVEKRSKEGGGGSLEWMKECRGECRE